MNRQSNPSNEHCLFAETLRNWRDPLLQGREKRKPILLCSRCASCKCQSLKDFHRSCPNCHSHRNSFSQRISIKRNKSKIPVRIFFDLPSTTTPTMKKKTSNNNESLYQSDLRRKRTRIPRLIVPTSFIKPSVTITSKDSISSIMDEQRAMKKVLKKRSRSTSNRRLHQQRISHSPGRSPSTSSSSISFIPSRKKTRLKSSSSISADEFHPNKFGLTKSTIQTWKNPHSSTEDDDNSYPKYSIEQVLPLTNTTTIRTKPTKDILLQRVQIDSWQNVDSSNRSILNSTCEESIGSAAHLLSPPIDGHVISISSATQPTQSSLLNQTKKTLWKVNQHGKHRRYSKIKSKSICFSPVESDSSTDQCLLSNSEKKKKKSMSNDDHQMAIPSASTDEDVDELPSHYSEILVDRSSHSTIDPPSNTMTMTIPTAPVIAPSANETSQMTMDSGVDLLSEHRPYPTFILPESNDLFVLSDDSMIDMTSDTITMRYEPRSLTSTYELEVITDEEDDQIEKDPNSELLITSEMTPVSTVRPLAPVPTTTLPPQFDFKLPTFGEWIDRVFTNFLSETTTTTTTTKSMASSRSSSIVSLPSSHETGKTVIENPTCSKKDSAPSSDDEDDMSSSSMNCEKIVYDSYMINSNYEKINSSFEEHDDAENARAVIDQCSQSSSAIEYVDQVNKIDDQMEPVQSSIFNEKILRQSVEDLMKQQTYLSSRDSALDLDEENHLPLEIVEQVLITEDVSPPSSSFSSSSAEQFIPKEKQTGMYYPAFGSDAPLHLNEDYPSEWFNSKNLRIVHPSQMIGDNEDEFFFSPRILVPSYSCSDLTRFTTTHDIQMHKRRLSLTALDIYQGQILTSEVFEQIWHSFLNLSPSEGEESDLNDYRLRHILGLGNSSLGEKSRSHNDIFTSPSPSSSLRICKKSKSFDITSLLKRGNTNRHESVQIGLLEGADISEPFGDRLVSSTSIHSDLESLPSFEIEPSSITTTKPSISNTNDEDHLISDEPSPVTSVEHEVKKNEQEEVFVLPPKRDTFTELCLFRPHSLSTIPSSRASQYASSVESDETSEHENRSIRKEHLSETLDDPMSLQISEDDPGMIGSEFSSTQSRSFTPEQFQQSKSLTLTSLTTMESLEEPSTEQIQLYQSLMPSTQQKLDKVTDLEIVQQGKGFKIGYVDRQGTDQRIILTKPVDKTDDIFERHPQVGLTYKGTKLLNQDFSSVYFTNGYEKIVEDRKFQHSDIDIEVPSIGTDPKHFDESDMISIDIDGPSTMLNAICESIVITQGSVYSNRSDRYLSKENSPTQIKRDRIEVTDHWHDQTVIHGSGTPWRSPLRTKTKQEVTTRDIALSPIVFHPTVDRSCQSSPIDDKSPWHSSTQVSSTDLPGLLKTSETNVSFTEDFPSRSTHENLERSADSGISVDTRHRQSKCHLALQVDLKSSSSDSEDLSELTPRATIERHSADLTRSLSSSCSELEQELFQLRRERTHIIDLLAMNWNRSNIWVELTEAKLNYIIGETDALLRNLSFDATSNSSEVVKTKMYQYEEDMTELTRQRLSIYRERLEDSKKQLDLKINELETKRVGKSATSSNDSIRSSYPKRIQSYLSTSAENLNRTSIDETLNNHPHLLDVSFLNSMENLPRERTTSDDHQRVIYRPTPRYPSIKSNLNKLEGLTDSQQAILDETNQLVQDSQQFHSESASQFERARESLLSSATSIELIRSNLAASRLTAHLSRELTLKELFKYEQLLTEETRRQHRNMFSTSKTRTES